VGHYAAFKGSHERCIEYRATKYQSTRAGIASFGNRRGTILNGVGARIGSKFGLSRGAVELAYSREASRQKRRLEWLRGIAVACLSPDERDDLAESAGVTAEAEYISRATVRLTLPMVLDGLGHSPLTSNLFRPLGRLTVFPSADGAAFINPPRWRNLWVTEGVSGSIR
jgi:hypothetical protein